MIDRYQRDILPERELEIMERIVGALQIATDCLARNDLPSRKDILSVLLLFSFGAYEQVIANTENGKIDEEIFAVSAEAWLKVIPEVAVSDVEDDGRSN